MKFGGGTGTKLGEGACAPGLGKNRHWPQYIRDEQTDGRTTTHM